MTTSFGALFFATFPMGLTLVSAPEPLLWRVASAFYAVGLVGIIWDVVRRRARLSAPSRAIVDASSRYAAALYALAAPVLASQILNVHPSLLASPAGVYFFGVLALIGASCATFVRTLFGPHPDRCASDPAAESVLSV